MVGCPVAPDEGGREGWREEARAGERKRARAREKCGGSERQSGDEPLNLDHL